MNESTGPAASAEAPRAAGNCVCGGRGPMLSQMLEMMMPAAAGEHFKNARIEMLKGMRELLDARIQTLSQEPRKGTKVHVE